MTPLSPEARRATIAACGGRGAVLDEVLAYCESPFDTAALGPVRFPLADEPHVDAWRRYAAAGGDALWPYLQARLPQLRAPIREGISATDAYARLVRRGEPVGEADLGGTLTLESTALRLEIPDHPAGALPVLVAPTRGDFERIYRALVCRSEPAPVSPAVNAQMIAGLVNWDRVHRVRASWAAGRDADEAAREWPQEMKRIAASEPERFYDRLILLCDAPYGGRQAREYGLDLATGAWVSASMRLRLEHEFTHYATKRVYGSMRLNLLDELIADAMGMTAALGGFRAHWFLTALGLSSPPPGPGARVHTYRGTLSDDAFRVACVLTARAAAALDVATARLYDPGARARYLLAVTAQTLDGLAAPGAQARVDEAWAWAGDRVAPRALA